MSAADIRIPAADAHYDLGDYLRLERRKGRRKVMETDLLEGLRRGGVRLLFAAVFTDPVSEHGTALEQAVEQLAAIQSELRESPGLFAICTDAAQVEAAMEAGKIALVLTLEGAEPLEGNLDLLEFFYHAGIRALGIAHARRNFACDGAHYTTGKYDLGGGLTAAGADLIRRARELGMLVDLSHLNDAGTADVLELTKGGLFASHSNCRAVCPTLRNLSDDQIRAISERGGIIGLSVCSAFVGDQPHTITMEQVLRHLRHLLEVAGEDHVCLGLDLAEMICPGVIFTVNGYSTPLKDLISNHGCLPEFAELLRQQGLAERTIRKLFSENLLRFVKDNLR